MSARPLSGLGSHRGAPSRKGWMAGALADLPSGEEVGHGSYGGDSPAELVRLLRAVERAGVESSPPAGGGGRTGSVVADGAGAAAGGHRRGVAGAGPPGGDGGHVAPGVHPP